MKCQITILASILLAFTTTTYAQSKKYKAFKVDVGLGYASPTKGGDGTKGGAVFTIEPHYRLSDVLSVGLRMEGAALGYANNIGTSDDIKISVLSSYCATGEYYLSNKGFRPFVSGGIGFFSTASVDIGSGTSTVVSPSTTQFGFFPRLGFETGHFRMSGEYNVIKDGGYLAFKLGFFFGGGKK